MYVSLPDTYLLFIRIRTVASEMLAYLIVNYYTSADDKGYDT